jgi:hypothetical protein
MDAPQYVQRFISQIFKSNWTDSTPQRRSSSKNLALNIPSWQFCLRKAISLVNATIRVAFWKAWRMWDEIFEGRRVGRNVSPRHGDQVSSSQPGEFHPPTILGRCAELAVRQAYL